MAQDPYRYFRLEARELLDQLAAGVLELGDAGTSPALVRRLLRLAHTLKGAARVVRQPEIADRAHLIEGALAPFREAAAGEAAGTAAAEAVPALLAHLDAAEARLAALAPAAPAPAPREPGPAVAAAPAEDAPRTIRAEIAEVDALLDGLAEARACLGGLGAAGGLVREARQLADLALDQLGPAAGAREAVAALRQRLGRLDRSLGTVGAQLGRELGQVRDAAEQLRLVPAGTMFAALERAARDAAAELGKPLAFAVAGGEARLDAFVLAAVQRALVQIVRNAVAHGIEPPAERRARGKPPAGRIEIGVARRGGRVVFVCRDDGGGVDLDAVRRVAVRRGLPAAEAARLGAGELVGLLLRGGISTAATVTELSGRGVGLDVVREAAGRLGGTVEVRTERGAGTTFEFAVPPTLASLDVLAVQAGEEVVAIPLDAVRTARRLAAGAVAGGAAGASVQVDGAALPFVPLAALLYGVRRPPGGACTAIVVAGAAGAAAFGIDRLLGRARVVMRPLPPHTAADGPVAGATLDAEGRPRLVLDPDALVAAARAADAAPFAPPPEKLPVLVIDDSLTTRMLEQSILEAAGYRVDLAVSAEDGLRQAHATRHALFLVDVEMPGMDGFAFVERIRADPALRDTPAILVTSRAAPEDRRRGAAAGADGYIVKSAFDQAELLRLIRSLVADR